MRRFHLPPVTEVAAEEEAQEVGAQLLQEAERAAGELQERQRADRRETPSW